MVVVAAVDRSEHARNVVAEAESLAKAFDDTVHVVHVMTQSEFLQLQSDSIEETNKPVDMTRVRNHAKEHAEEAARDISVPHESVGLVGGAKEEILRYTDENDTRYVVIGTAKRSPTGKALFGSVAQSILLGSECPVVGVMSPP